MQNQQDNGTLGWAVVVTCLLALCVGAGLEVHFGFLRGDPVGSDVSRKQVEKLETRVDSLENRQASESEKLRDLTKRVDFHLGRSGVPAGAPTAIPQRQ